MKNLYVLLAIALLLTSCGQKQDSDTTLQDEHAMMSNNADDAGTRDVSTEALVLIDEAIQQYHDNVVAAVAAYDDDASEANREALIEAYIAFGDYMTYESPVSPRQGKYHRALIEYRHALKLDPSNDKVLDEIAQIEDIYRSMNRPVPGEESM